MISKKKKSISFFLLLLRCTQMLLAKSKHELAKSSKVTAQVDHRKTNAILTALTDSSSATSAMYAGSTPNLLVWTSAWCTPASTTARRDVAPSLLPAAKSEASDADVPVAERLPLRLLLLWLVLAARRSAPAPSSSAPFGPENGSSDPLCSGCCSQNSMIRDRMLWLGIRVVCARGAAVRGDVLWPRLNHSNSISCS